MLKKYAACFSLLQSIVDAVIVGSCWIVVYFVRFQSGLFDVGKGIPDFERHLILTLPVVFISYMACLLTGLYKPKRIKNIFVQLVDIFKASMFTGLFVLAFFYYLQDAPYSRKLLALFVIMLFFGFGFSHVLTMVTLRKLRARGYNLRYCAVIGTGQQAQQLVRDIERMEWLGLRCIAFVDSKPRDVGAELMGIAVCGPVERLLELVRNETVDEVYLASNGNEAQAAYPVLEALQSESINIRIIPDWGNLASLRGATATTIGSQVLFSAADSPLDGTNVVLKEVFDRVVALALLVLLAVPMALIAALIKLTSRGPVFYRQIRIGMDKKEFQILKFRTMVTDAEQENGPQWARTGDPRCTRIGAWLRRMSLDELPQLVNVVKGQMSLVGPRPERPVFARQFSEEYKKYMLRHKVKAGMTGWAQISGLRGDTSLRKRLVYDLYYVRNWSWGLDMWILLLTPWRILKGENAY